ncbi:hypothetical protein FA95DRAFT_1128736 [Auriscalpium vulgare]|uniref:Uncharacterized protein n=1 Tax=Auriscalpium vulgare TaxID=40419 RepID=A0ACB8R412_9AGAM|nr:hypothetical protein FA95DRAFT_1128736 [Auriscalpium vulgare]
MNSHRNVVPCAHGMGAAALPSSSICLFISLFLGLCGSIAFLTTRAERAHACAHTRCPPDTNLIVPCHLFLHALGTFHALPRTALLACSFVRGQLVACLVRYARSFAIHSLR